MSSAFNLPLPLPRRNGYWQHSFLSPPPPPARPPIWLEGKTQTLSLPLGSLDWALRGSGFFRKSHSQPAFSAEAVKDQRNTVGFMKMCQRKALLLKRQLRVMTLVHDLQEEQLQFSNLNKALHFKFYFLTAFGYLQ